MFEALILRNPHGFNNLAQIDLTDVHRQNLQTAIRALNEETYSIEQTTSYTVIPLLSALSSLLAACCEIP